MLSKHHGSSSEKNESCTLHDSGGLAAMYAWRSCSDGQPQQLEPPVILRTEDAKTAAATMQYRKCWHVYCCIACAVLAVGCG